MVIPRRFTTEKDMTNNTEPHPTALIEVTDCEISEPDLPNHVVGMRRVLQRCLEAAAFTCDPLSTRRNSSTSHEALALPKQIRERSREAFCQQPSPLRIPEIDSIDDISPADFRERFQRSNLPCKFKSMGQYFRYTDSEWTVPANDQTTSRSINHDWFLSALGPEAMVPVRVSGGSDQTTTATLDDQGRATECQVQSMALQTWIDLITNSSKQSTSATGKNETSYNLPTNQYYLKDWHLQKQLQQSSASHSNNDAHSLTAPITTPLYTLPPHFAPDLLNDYLSYSQSDYKFVYWGPMHSQTTWHSDVMSSFSWSYNVCGSKEWIFQLPNTTANTTITLTQQAGECVFVPANWKHQVMNTAPGSTLSINHNWITTANLDLVWEGILTEMRDIQVELCQWDNHQDALNNNAEALESMLLGCVGLNVTAFVLMVMLGIINVVDAAEQGSDDTNNNDTDSQINLQRLGAMLQTILHQSGELNLEPRLGAALMSKRLGSATFELAKVFSERILERPGFIAVS